MGEYTLYYVMMQQSYLVTKLNEKMAHARDLNHYNKKKTVKMKKNKAY